MSDFIEDYLLYTSSQESPTVFHRWCAISAVASALSRKVVLPRTNRFGVEFFRTWPGQVSIVLVAGAGRCKKSTAVNLIAELMKRCPGINVYEGKITPEQLLHKLAELPTPRLTVVAEELSAFLTKTSYNDGLVDILNKLIDGSNNPYETRKSKIELQSPALVMLCATTPTNLAKAILPQAIGHGYASRQIYVYSEDPGAPEPLAYSEAPDARIVSAYEALKTSLIVRLQGYTELSGEFRWNRHTERWYTQWYLQYKASGLSEGEGWPQRYPDHLIRVAMVLAVSRGLGTFEFVVEDLQKASDLLEEVNASMDKVFAHVGQHINSERQEKLLNIFRAKNTKLGKAMSLVSMDELYQGTIKWYPNTNELNHDLTFLRNAAIIDLVTGNNYVLLKDPK